jgi:hypothetical protein
MPKNNVTPLKFGSVTLDNVNQSLDAWRSSKKKQNEKIPTALWEQIFSLLKNHTEAELRSVLGLTSIQIERGKQAVQEANVLMASNVSAEVEPLDFCEAHQAPAYPLASKPAEAFATNTSIVELRRPDGMLMKIHICTDRFEELLHAFFKG